MLFRLYTPADFAALYALEQSCFEPPFRFARSYMQELVDAPGSATWVAEDGGELAGFAIVEWMDGVAEIVAYIQTIEVAPARRGCGIAAELLHRVEDSARAVGASLIRLHVDAENAGAIRLYQRHGYAREGRIERYYPRGRAALVYVKVIEAHGEAEPLAAGI